MKVQRIELENYKVLQGKHEFNPNGCSFYLLAGNGEGKSTVGRLVMDLLTKNLPSKPVTEGEKMGYVEITLDNGDKIYYRFSDGGRPDLEIIAANGGKITAISDLFKKMAGSGMDFNINEFLKLAPKPRRAMLEKMAGVDFTEINNREKNAEDDRKALNARLKDQKARVTPYDETLIGKTKVNTGEVSQKLSDAISTNNAIKTAVDKGENLSREVADIQIQIDALLKKQDMLRRSIIDLENYLKVNTSVALNVIEDYKTQIANADKTNSSIDAAIKAKAEFDLATELEEKAAEAQAEVEKIREEKEELIRAAKLPADGLTFSPDGETLLIDGLPFEDTQIATSRKMIAAIQIAESMLGTLKFLHLDASILDKENAAKLLEWAESKGLQLALERSMWEGGELKFEVYSPKNE